jgi:putative ABC transport system permease protein
MTLAESWDRIELIEGEPAQARRQIEAGATGISEPLANRYNLHVGDTLVLGGRHGTVELPVAAVFRDFSLDRGYGFTHWRAFVDAFGDPGVRNMALHLNAENDAERTAAELRDRLASRFRLTVRANRVLRDEVFKVFNRTFQLTYLLQTISTAMALAGIAITLLALVLERAHEIDVLRALGARRIQIARLFVAESLLLAMVPATLALPLGALLAWLLIAVVNLRAFGWTLHFAWPWGSVLLTCGLAVLAGLIATLVPLALVRRQRIALDLREE